MLPLFLTSTPKGQGAVYYKLKACFWKSLRKLVCRKALCRRARACSRSSIKTSIKQQTCSQLAYMAGEDWVSISLLPPFFVL